MQVHMLYCSLLYNSLNQDVFPIVLGTQYIEPKTIRRAHNVSV